ncbi:MAG: SRPBCC family protein [Acidimicrobiales bacterium]
MAGLLPRTIEWIHDAPISIEATSESAASPEQVFAVLADHERWPEWFPSVRKVTVLGQAEGVGARRRVTIPGASVDEEFIIWEPGRRWSFTGIAARPRFTKSLLEDCQLDALDGGGTAITYTMYLDPPAALRPMGKAIARGIRANNRRAMANLARRAAERGD